MRVSNQPFDGFEANFKVLNILKYILADAALFHAKKMPCQAFDVKCLANCLDTLSKGELAQVRSFGWQG